jgi:seryl-tRNA synthetase
MRPYKLDSAIARLTKTAQSIERLGKTMSIEINDEYERLRRVELELTADYINKVAEEKERDREEKARLREEAAAQREIQREREKLEKERNHYANALAALEAKGDSEGAARLRAQLADVDQAIADVDYRAANIRAGYVYVISNHGAFGQGMVKVGMTRRLEPMDRVRELSDASVPFNFDVHAIFFADDAVGIETTLHQRLAHKRVNRVNLRREFFYATPGEVKALLGEVAGSLLHFEDLPEALEYHQSLTAAGRDATSEG